MGSWKLSLPANLGASVRPTLRTFEIKFAELVTLPVPAVNHHLDALWYLLRNGCAWRALPREFGPWQAVHQYFNRLSKNGFFEYLQKQLLSGGTGTAPFTRSISMPTAREALRIRPLGDPA